MCQCIVLYETSILLAMEFQIFFMDPKIISFRVVSLNKVTCVWL
jgi:hypothetical protein